MHPRRTNSASFPSMEGMMSPEVSMTNRIFTLASGAVIGALVTSATLLSCQHMGNRSGADYAATQQAGSQPATSPDKIAATISSGELRDILADLADSHNDKTKLA